MTISIVIPCRNEAAFIERCVASILRQRVGEHSIEVILSDGMSDDGTRDILDRLAAEDSRVHVVDNPRRIVSTGLNAAIQAASGQIILRMDAHTEYAPDYVLQCLRTLEKTGADNVGGPWVAKGEGYLSRAIAAAFQSPFAVGGARSHDPEYEGEVDSVYLGCWRREIFDRIGFFDEELVRNQDDEFNLRLVRSGGRIWQSPEIRSWYQSRTSLRDLFRQYLQYGYWKVRVIQKHRLPASIRHLAPAGFITALVVLAAASSLGTIPAFALVIIVAAYVFGVAAASVIAAAHHDLSVLPVLPLVFGCYHFGYGLGFLRGMLDFLVLRRVSPFASDLTRTRQPSSENPK